MRILLSGVPAFGHLLPLAPLAAAAHRAGHEVRLLTSGGMTDLISADIPDAPLLSAGPMPDVLFAEVARRFEGSDPARNPQPETVADFFAGSRVDLSVDEAIEKARAFAPDFIIAEATDFVGPMVAAALDVPWSVLAFGPAVPDEFTAPMRDVVSARYRERNLTATVPRNYIDPSPEALQQPGWVSPVNRLAIRTGAHSRAKLSGYVSRFPTGSDKKNVLITLGTVFSDPAVVSKIISSIDRARFNIVATKGVIPGIPFPEDEDGLAYVGFVPLAELLDDVDIVVNAGGAGTVLGTLSRGLPMVVWPQGADQFINAARAADSGTAIVVNDPAEIGNSLRAITDNDQISTAAHRVATEIASAPSASDVIAELVRQAASAGYAA
jgi:UDP:flavonoid glycosyltransferase YjiC (YdhE family)